MGIRGLTSILLKLILIGTVDALARESERLRGVNKELGRALNEEEEGM